MISNIDMKDNVSGTKRESGEEGSSNKIAKIEDHNLSYIFAFIDKISNSIINVNIPKQIENTTPSTTVTTNNTTPQYNAINQQYINNYYPNNVNTIETNKHNEEIIYLENEFRDIILGVILDINDDTNKYKNFFYLILNNDNYINDIIIKLNKNGLVYDLMNRLNFIIDSKYEIFLMNNVWILIKYPYNIKQYNQSDKYLIDNIIEYGKKKCIFIRYMYKWINFCLDNNIPKMEQYNHLKYYLDINVYLSFFYVDNIAFDYWNKYGYQPPLLYLNIKLDNIKIVFNKSIKNNGDIIVYIENK